MIARIRVPKTSLCRGGWRGAKGPARSLLDLPSREQEARSGRILIMSDADTYTDVTFELSEWLL